MAELVRRWFPTVVGIIYTGGTIAHVLRLIVRYSWRDMPFFVDWLLVILGPFGVLGLVVFAKEVEYRGTWERITHWLITAHLSVSVLVHIWILATWSHAAVSVFPYSYSYFALLYFAFFAWRSWTMRVRAAPAPGPAPR